MSRDENPCLAILLDLSKYNRWSLSCTCCISGCHCFVQYSTTFEEEYSKKLIDLYIAPWWRLLVALLVLTSAVWCPRVGILIALIVFFYLSDMNTLIKPFTDL